MMMHKQKGFTALELVITALILGFLSYLGYQGYQGNLFGPEVRTEETSAPAVVLVEALAGDKPAQKVEMVKSTRNDDGTIAVVALLTYPDGQQENCTFVMVAETAQEGGSLGLDVNPKSRTCTSVMKAN